MIQLKGSLKKIWNSRNNKERDFPNKKYYT